MANWNYINSVQPQFTNNNGGTSGIAWTLLTQDWENGSPYSEIFATFYSEKRNNRHPFDNNRRENTYIQYKIGNNSAKKAYFATEFESYSKDTNYTYFAKPNTYALLVKQYLTKGDVVGESYIDDDNTTYAGLKIRIYHNLDGTCPTFQLGGYWEAHTTVDSVYNYGSFTINLTDISSLIPTINTNSVIKRFMSGSEEITEFNISGLSPLKFKVELTEYMQNPTYSITYSFGNLVDQTEGIIEHPGSGYFEFSPNKELSRQLQNSLESFLVFKLITYIEGTQIGTATGRIKLKIPDTSYYKPTISTPTLSEQRELPAQCWGSTFFLGKSKILIIPNDNDIPGYGVIAPLTYSCVTNRPNLTVQQLNIGFLIDTENITGINDFIYTLTAVDSRGRSSEISATVNFSTYTAPTINSITMSNSESSYLKRDGVAQSGYVLFPQGSVSISPVSNRDKIKANWILLYNNTVIPILEEMVVGNTGILSPFNVAEFTKRNNITYQIGVKLNDGFTETNYIYSSNTFKLLGNIALKSFYNTENKINVGTNNYFYKKSSITFIVDDIITGISTIKYKKSNENTYINAITDFEYVSDHVKINIPDILESGTMYDFQLVFTTNGNYFTETTQITGIMKNLGIVIQDLSSNLSPAAFKPFSTGAVDGFLVFNNPFSAHNASYYNFDKFQAVLTYNGVTLTKDISVISGNLRYKYNIAQASDFYIVTDNIPLDKNGINQVNIKVVASNKFGEQFESNSIIMNFDFRENMSISSLTINHVINNNVFDFSESSPKNKLREGMSLRLNLSVNRYNSGPYEATVFIARKDSATTPIDSDWKPLYQDSNYFNGNFSNIIGTYNSPVSETLIINYGNNKLREIVAEKYCYFKVELKNVLTGKQTSISTTSPIISLKHTPSSMISSPEANNGNIKVNYTITNESLGFDYNLYDSGATSAFQLICNTDPNPSSDTVYSTYNITTTSLWNAFKNAGYKDIILSNWEHRYIKWKHTSTITIIYSEGNSITTTKTQITPIILTYNLIPTISPRKNAIGINKSLSEDDVGLDNRVLVINQIGDNKILYFLGLNRSIQGTINLETGAIDGFVFDGGSWS